MMSWNSTQKALACLTAIIIAGMAYGVDLQALAVVIAPLGAYVAIRENSRIKSQ